MFQLLTPSRRLLNFAFSLSILTTFSANALQLGQPIVKSRLGEPLKLEVQISDLSAQEAQDFQADLASESVYQAAKINRVDGLDNLQVSLTKRAEDLYVMQIQGADPLVDTYVDLLMEFRWASGRAYRNLGFPLSGTLNNALKTAPAAEALTSPSDNESLVNKQPRPAPLPKGAPGQDSAPRAKAKKDKPAPAGNTPDGDTIEVIKGDTASELIMANPTGDVSLDQLLVTMLRNNPTAFVNNNVNRLKAGALITMPTVEEARTVDRQAARQSIRLQSADFDAYRAQLAGRVPTTPLADANARESSGGLKAQVQNNAQPPADQLTLSKPGAKDAADQVSQDLQAADATRRSNEVAKNVTELDEISQAAGKMQEGVPTNMTDLSSSYQQAMGWVKRHAFELIGGLAVLAALWVSYSLFRQRRPQAALSDKKDFDYLQHPQHKPPGELNLDFNLDLPPHPTGLPEDPFQVRLDLADELWKLGQKQTGRALAQEVADQTHGETRERALRWLNERG